MKCVCLILFLFFSKTLCGEPLRFSISNETQYFYLSPKNSADIYSKTEVKSNGALDLSDDLSLKYDTTLNYVYLNKQDRKQAVVNPDSLGLFGSASFFDYRIGFWQHAAEGTDLNNLFDVVHAKDYRNPFSTENFSAAGLHLSSTFDFLNWQIFYIPQNLKSILPDTQSPWWPRTDALPLANSAGTFYLPENVSYKYRNESEYRDPFKNNWGSSAKLTFDRFDLHLMFFSGANQIPKISPQFNIDVTSITPLVGVVRPPIELDLTWTRAQHGGAGFSTVLGSFIVKAFCKTQKNIEPTETQADSCNGALESSLDIRKYSLRYFVQINRLWKKQETSAELETLLGFFEKSVSAGFMLELNPENIFSGAAVYNEKSPSVLTSARIERRWTDSFRTVLGLNIITAQNQPLAKAYDQTDNTSLKLIYDF